MVWRIDAFQMFVAHGRKFLFGINSNFARVFQLCTCAKIILCVPPSISSCRVAKEEAVLKNGILKASCSWLVFVLKLRIKMSTTSGAHSINDGKTTKSLSESREQAERERVLVAWLGLNNWERAKRACVWFEYFFLVACSRSVFLHL